MVKTSGNGRIEKIIAVVKRASQGDHTVRLDISEGNDLLDALAAAINELTDSLSKRSTSYKQMEIALLDRVRLLRYIFDQNPYPIWISDDKGTLIRINRACCDMLNIQPDEVIGKYNILQDDVVIEQGYLSLVKSVFDEGKTVDFLIEYDSAKLKSLNLINRNFVILDVTISPVKDENGTITNAVIIHHDITKRKQLEEELKFFHFSIESATDAVFWLDCNGQITYVNEQACRSLGYTREELQSLYIWDIDPDFPEDRWAITWEESAKLRERLIETMHRHKNGTLFPVEVSANHIKLGGKEHHVAFVRDITKRKTAETELSQSKELLDSIINGIADSIFVKDEEHRWIALNDAFCKMLGYTRSEILGKSDYDLFPKDQADVFWAHDDMVMASDKPDVNDEEISIGEQTRTISTIKSSFKNPITGKRNLVGTIRDITERKKAEKEKAKLEAQLQQAQKMESIGTLAGGVAHEINNPINAIMNYAQLIKDRSDDDSSLAQFADEIIHETERTAKIVKNLLTFAREERASHSPARMIDIVNDTMSLIQTVFRQDQITLNVEVPEDLPKIKCRSQQIQQVVMNLMTNARDALNDKYAAYDENKLVKISSNLFEKDGRRWIRTTVEDHGVGIDPNISETMFDPFFTTKGRTVGTGLGLSISYGIVKDHHGELTFESEPGQYTRFHMDLPVDNGWDLEKNAQN